MRAPSKLEREIHKTMEAWGGTVEVLPLRDSLSQGRWFPSINPSLGAIYASLNYLMLRGLVERHRDDSGDRVRYYYTLTGKGEL